MTTESESQTLKDRAEKLYEETCHIKKQIRELHEQMKEFQVHHAQFLVKFSEF